MTQPPLPEALEALAWLMGSWSVGGAGEYPTIESFEYREESTFTHPQPDVPALLYTQRTWIGGAPSHAETGYLRGVPGGRAELVVAQPGGRVEVHDGTVADDRIELTSVLVGCTPTAKLVTEVRRTIERRGEFSLWYRLDMAAVGEDLLYHCEAVLHRVAPIG